MGRAKPVKETDTKLLERQENDVTTCGGEEVSKGEKIKLLNVVRRLSDN